MPTNSDELSEREMEILRLVATGASNKEIARELSISTNTVKVHMRNIFNKIEVNSRTEAAMYAVNAGFIPATPQGQMSADASLASIAMGTGKIDKSEILSLGSKLVANRLLTASLILFLIGVVGVAFFFWQQSRNNNLQLEPAVGESFRWQVLAPMSVARAGLAVSVHDGLIYAIAGETEDGVTPATERYDPETDAWESLSDKPTAVSDVGSAVIGGRIYVPGGRLSSGEITDLLEIYDPRQDTWSLGAVIPQAISAYALIAFEGKLYLFGGWDGENYLDSVYEYDPGSDLWSPRSSLSFPRAFAGAAVAGGKIYLMGGYDGQQAFTVNEIYMPGMDDGVNRPWREGKSLPDGRYGMGITSLAEVIYLVGGESGNSESIPISWGYLVQEGEWRAIDLQSNEQRAFLGLTNLGTNLYAVGGFVDETLVSYNSAYQAIYTISFPLVINQDETK